MPAPVTLNGGDMTVPPGSTQVTATSGNVAAGSAVATMAATANVTNWIVGFDITGTGATVGAVVAVTIAGLLGGSITYTLASATGATVMNTPLSIRFPFAIPASAANIAITVTCPSLGAGSTNNVVNAFGYRV